MENVLKAKYGGANVTTHKISALDGAEVQLKSLTIKEIKTIAKDMIKGSDKNGEPIIDYEKAGDSQLKKISLALVEPKMTMAELEALSNSAKDALDEILAIVDPKTAEAMKNAKEKAGK